MKTKLYRWVLWPLWYVALPLGLATLTVSLLGQEPGTLPERGAFGALRWFASDQKVPAIIVAFTLFELLLFRFRHSVPFADQLGLAGRPGLPKSHRKLYEQASHLLTEAQRTLARREKEIVAELGATRKQHIEEVMQSLFEAMEKTPFDAAAFDDAYQVALEAHEQHLSRWQRGELREYTESILIAVGVALLLRAFVVEAFKIPSGSMLPTLQIQDHIFVNKFVYGLKIPTKAARLFDHLPPGRGDIVVFEYPDQNPQNPRQDFIKRVIALPGDVLEVQGGHPIINGWPVPHCRVGTYTFGEESGYPETGELFVEFLGDYSYLTLFEDGRDDGRQGPYRVKDGEFWVLGDNRNNSSDSRAWQNGRGAGVPFPNVKGRAMFVWLSFNELGQDALGVTWDRLFTNVLGSPRLPKEASPELKQGIERCLASRPNVTLPPESRPTAALATSR